MHIKNIDIEKMKKRVRHIFVLMLVVILVAGISPVYFATAEVSGESSSYIEINEIYQRIVTIEKENRMLKEKIAMLEKENNTLKKQISKESEENQKLKQKIISLNNQISKLKAQNTYLEGTVVSLKNILLSNLKGLSQGLKKLPGIKIEKFLTTAYVPGAGGINCSGDCNTTAKLFKVSAIEEINDITYCAVDPKVIPLYSILIIQGLDKPCVAVDTGGKIKGHHIDIMMKSLDDARRWGRKNRMVIVIHPKVK